MRTTTTRLPANCTVCNVRLTSKNRASAVCGTIPGSYDDLCVRCYEEDDQDWVPDAAPVDTGRTNRSHASCGHARTSSARARCRREKSSLRDDAGL